MSPDLCARYSAPHPALQQPAFACLPAHLDKGRALVAVEHDRLLGQLGLAVRAAAPAAAHRRAGGSKGDAMGDATAEYVASTV